jgi:cell fate regulator YaaT (PSP1 superfamily)
MPIVCGVRFRNTGKVYHFDPGELPVAVSDHVIVNTTRGDELGQVSEAPHEVTNAQVVGELKPVLRMATLAELARAEQYWQKEAEVVPVCQEQIVRAGLDMKVVSAEYSYDGSRLTFYFTAQDRVDFRSLVRDLARTFKARIDLRQIGVRDEARLVGGLGPCGRPLCCATWLTQFQPVSIRMAKQQNLPLSPMEISGLCGRLLCCLTYENDYYHEIRGQFPKVGRTVDTPYGTAKVIKVSVLRETVTVLLEDGTTVDMTADQLSGAEPMAPREAGVESASLTSSLRRAAGPLQSDDQRDPAPSSARTSGQNRSQRTDSGRQEPQSGPRPGGSGEREQPSGQRTGTGGREQPAGQGSGRDGAQDARRSGGAQDSSRPNRAQMTRPGDTADRTEANRSESSGPEGPTRKSRSRSGRRRRGPRGSVPAVPADGE